MNPAFEQLDPNLEEVLRDIAADPRAKLFVTSPRAAMAGLTVERLEVSSCQAGLVAAERQLLDVYRAEMAYLLRAAYWERQLSSKESAWTYYPYACLDVSTWERRARRACDLPLGELGGPPLLRSILASDDWVKSEIDNFGLLWASLRLQDAANARLYLAIEHNSHGQSRSGLRVAETLLKQPLSAVHEHAAWDSVGRSLSDLDRVPESASAYREALATADGAGFSNVQSANTLLSLFVQTAQQGDRTRTERIGRRIDASFRRDDSFICKRIVLLAQAKRDQEVGITSGSDEPLRGYAEHLGPISRELINAILNY